MRFLKALFAGLIASITFPLIYVLKIVTFFPILILGGLKNLIRYTREAWQTGWFGRFIMKSLAELIRLTLSIAINILWYAGVVYSFYPFFLAWQIIRGLNCSFVAGIGGVIADCTAELHQIAENFNHAINLERGTVVALSFDRALSNTGIARDKLELSEAAFNKLKANQLPPLSDEEKAQLERVKDQAIKNTFIQYKDLRARLEPESRECCITWEILTQENTVLLVKLYQRGEEELPVPNSSFVYDKAGLTEWFAARGTHPETRDVILAPPVYEGCRTRYVHYSYYASSDLTSGVSQELNDKIAVLRPYLVQHPELGATAAGAESLQAVLVDAKIRKNIASNVWCTKFSSDPGVDVNSQGRLGATGHDGLTTSLGYL